MKFKKNVENENEALGILVKRMEVKKLFFIVVSQWVSCWLSHWTLDWEIFGIFILVCTIVENYKFFCDLPIEQ